MYTGILALKTINAGENYFSGIMSNGILINGSYNNIVYRNRIGQIFSFDSGCAISFRSAGGIVNWNRVDSVQIGLELIDATVTGKLGDLPDSSYYGRNRFRHVNPTCA